MMSTTPEYYRVRYINTMTMNRFIFERVAFFILAYYTKTIMVFVCGMSVCTGFNFTKTLFGTLS